MPVTERYAFCKSCQQWIGKQVPEAADQLQVSCPDCQAALPLRRIEDARFLRKTRRSLTKLMKPALDQWLAETVFIDATSNVAYSEILARACHVACEATHIHREVGTQEHAAAKALIDQLVATGDRFGLPMSLLFGEGRRAGGELSVLGMVERIQQCLTWLKKGESGVPAVDLSEDAQKSGEDRFFPSELFVTGLLGCAGLLLREKQKLDEELQAQRLEIGQVLRRKLDGDCEGSRPIATALGYAQAWAEGPKDVEQIVRHLRTCPQARHRQRILVTLPALARDGFIADKDACQTMEEALSGMAERQQVKLLQEGECFGNPWFDLRMALRISSGMVTAWGHSLAMDKVCELCPRVRMVEGAEQAEVHTLPQLGELQTFEPRMSPTESAGYSVINSLRAVSTLRSLLRGQTGSPIFDLPLQPLIDHVLGLLDRLNEQTTLPAEEKEKTEDKSNTHTRQRLGQILGSIDAEFFAQLERSVGQPGGAKQPATLAMIEQVAYERRRGAGERRAAMVRQPASGRSPRPALRANGDAHDPARRAKVSRLRDIGPRQLPGCLGSPHLLARDGALPSLKDLPQLPDKAMERLQELLGQRLSLRNEHHCRNFGLFSFELARSMGSQDFWFVYARRRWLAESYAFSRRAEALHREHATTHRDHWKLERLQQQMLRIAKFYGEGCSQNDVEVEASLLHLDEPEVPGFPTRLELPNVNETTTALAELSRYTSFRQIEDFFKRLGRIIPPGALAGPSGRFLTALCPIVLDGRTPQGDLKQLALWAMIASSLPTRSSAPHLAPGRGGEQRQPFTAGEAVPIVMDAVLRALVRVGEPQAWFGPPAQDLGDLLSLLRRDPGLGQHWHHQLYQDFPQEPSASILTLARMGAKVAQSDWQERQGRINGFRAERGTAERELLSLVSGGVAALAGGLPAEPYRAAIWDFYVLHASDLCAHMGQDIPDADNKESIYFPRCLLYLLEAGQRDSLPSNIDRNSRRSAAMRAASSSAPITQPGRLSRYAIWQWGSGSFKGKVRSLDEILADESLLPVKAARLFMQLTLVSRDSAGNLQARDGMTGQPLDASSERIPAKLRAQAGTLPPEALAYVFSFALNDAARVGSLYDELLQGLLS